MNHFYKFAGVLFAALLSPSILAAQSPDIGKGTVPTASISPIVPRFYDTYIRNTAPTEDAFVVVQHVAAQYITYLMWDSAASVFEKYKPLFPAMQSRFDSTVSLLETKNDMVSVTNLGAGVNTDADEYKATPSADGSLLYFTRNARKMGTGGDEIYVARNDGGKWEDAQPLDPTEQSMNESVNSISTDGNTLLIFGNNSESFGDGDIYYKEKTMSGWGPLKHYPPPINTEYFESDAFLSSDGKALFFVSDRPGGVGGYHPVGAMYHGDQQGNTDIYVCVWQDTGWSDPINLGPTINTPECERTPFLHPDGKTLYFSSAGHNSIGGLDVYKSTRLSNDSWTEWSTPVNLGKRINTPGNDIGYKVTTGGDVAYFSAENRAGGYGGYDLYSLTLPKVARPERVATIRGKVVDSAGNPLEVTIRWENLDTHKNVGQLHTDPKTGQYFIALPIGHEYGYYAEREGYFPVSKNIDLRNVKEADSIDMVQNDLSLISLEDMKKRDISVRINNVFFAYDKADLEPESFSELDRLAKLLKENPDVKIEIDGYTDSDGGDAYNMDLSERRAQAIVDYLIKVGCKADNLIAHGFGKTRPIAANDTEEGRALNRRVEFKVAKDNERGNSE